MCTPRGPGGSYLASGGGIDAEVVLHVGRVVAVLLLSRGMRTGEPVESKKLFLKWLARWVDLQGALA